MNAHDEWASYLDPETSPERRSELAGAIGDHEAAALDRVAGLLSDEAVWGEPSGEIRSRLLDQVAAERQASVDLAGPDSGIGSDSPGPGDDELSRRRDRRNRGFWMGGGLLTAAAAIVIAVLALGPLSDRAEFETYEVAGTALTPDLAATVDVEPRAAGVAITLHIKGLPPAGDGEYYAAWVMPEMSAMADDSMADDATADDSMADDDAMADDSMADDSMADAPMVGIGSFHWREGGIPIELWSGVDTDRYPIMIVTLQEETEPPLASDEVVMTARLSSE